MMKRNKKHVQETQERVCNTQKYKMKRKREKKKYNECHRYKRLHVEGEEEKRIMAERMSV